jgi:chromosomal replication initiation ATPase DnaA
MVVGDFAIMDSYRLDICDFDRICYYCGEKKEKMISEVSARTMVSDFDILGKSRIRKFVDARHAYWWVLHNNGFSHTLIGRLCEVDHSTVTLGLKSFRRLLEAGDAESVRIFNLVKDIKL